MAKKQKLFRLTDNSINTLSQYAKEHNISESETMEIAISKLNDSEIEMAEILAEKLVAELDAKYKNWMDRIRLGVRTADINSQILLDSMNTILFYNGLSKDSYTPVYEKSHDVIALSEQRIKNMINNAKQRKDFNGGDK